MPANVDGMVRAGIEAYKSGDKTEARTLLERAIELDEHNETAWLWLSAVVDDKEEQQICLENVLIINPDNERAKQGLQSLGVNPDAATEAEPADSTPAFTDDIDEYEAYDVPSSSASVQGDDAYVDEDYDQWMDDLDLGGTESAAPADDDAAIFDDDDFGGDAFADVSFDDDVGYDDYAYDDYAATDDDYAYDDYAADDYSADADYAVEADADPYAGDPYAVDDDDLDALFEDDADAFADDLDYDAAEEPASADTLVDESIFDDDLGGFDDDFGAGDEYAYDDEYADSPVDDYPAASATGVQEFDQIPASIEPTRLPGEDEAGGGISPVVVGLGVLNLVAIGLIIVQFVVPIAPIF